MEWAEELFTLKRSAKKGRRAAASDSTGNSPPVMEPKNDKPNSGTSINALADSFDEDLELNSVPKPRKIGVWSDEPIKTSGKFRGGAMIEQERMQRPSISSLSSKLDFDDNIPIIPDIEDLQDDPPLDGINESNEFANRSSTHQALNTDVLKQGAFAFLDDIDLSILARCLLNECDLVEPDNVWTWEKLFTEVSGDIHADKPKSADASPHFLQ